MRLMSWTEESKNGAFQKQSAYEGIPYGLLLTVKPKLSFEYTNLNYNEFNRTFTRDNIELTDEEKSEIINIIDAVPFEDDFIFQTETREYYETLKSTDWYVSRFAETGVEIPQYIKDRRAFARTEISLLKEKFGK